MATNQEIEQRHSVIRGWLETGANHSTVATMVSARFGVSRSTAYSDIGKVQATVDASDDGPSTEETSEHDVAGVLGMLQHQFNIAAANGDVPAMTKLVAAMTFTEKTALFGQSAEEGLAEVQVALDEPGKEKVAGEVG